MPILVDMAFKLMNEEVDGFLEALSDENLASFLILGAIQVLRHHVFDFFRPTHPTL